MIRSFMEYNSKIKNVNHLRDSLIELDISRFCNKIKNVNHLKDSLVKLDISSCECEVDQKGFEDYN